jgi:hypothetical protein
MYRSWTPLADAAEEIGIRAVLSNDVAGRRAQPGHPR